MPRKPIDPADPDKLQHYLGVMFNARQIALIARVASAQGITRGAAVRLMMDQGARWFDPDESTEE